MTRKKYYSIIEKMMKFDSNCSIDTLLIECENNFKYACEVLKSVIERLIDEEYNEFYKEILIEGWM